MKKMFSLVLVGVLLTMLISGCSSSATNQGSKNEPTEAASGQKTIGVLIAGQNAPYLASYVKGLQKEAEAQNVELVILDAEWKIDKQSFQMQNLITKKVDAIVLNAVDAKAIVPALVKAQSSNIPIIAGNVGLEEEGNKYIKAFTGADSITEGQGAAQLIKEALHGKGNIVQIIGSPGMEPTINRKKGFEEELAKIAPDIQIVASEVGGWDKAKSVTAMENLLTANPDIQGVYAHDDTMAVGAIQALKEHKKDSIKVVGIGGSAAGIDAIKVGDMYGTNLQSPVQDGVEAIKVAVKLINKENIEFFNYIEIPKITKENVANFTPEW
ncbi:sugar ABC transporter substrate-binding protein [Cytobacillus purgationiresistens]|uniref:Ribose transport system substrate-binding protein n=1 Tax=Cytobacillus purgationiresistens TaxID=863449 RepID=A0ABU0AM77_9BACI|nr:sugar ABC transporter substrate-binding protein [Cytobacillus purgationiresistens]MDQ0272363.1 ribose transport system substrate-binding protein [Cytobacillus purgationiresistens]